MPRYLITLTRRIPQSAAVILDAENTEEAAAKALRQILPWHLDDFAEPRDVDRSRVGTVKEVGPAEPLGVETVEGYRNTWVDDAGTVWTAPTAHAYAMVCKARDKWQARAEVLAAADKAMPDGAAAQDLAALSRADEIICWMAEYIGKMAAPSNGIADLNEHWLYIEKLTAAGTLPKRKPVKTEMTTALDKQARDG